MLKMVRMQAKTLFYQRARRDHRRSALCISRMLLGLWLLFQPLVYVNLASQPIGRATWQLFYASHFYLRLGWLIVARSDFFDVPRSHGGKLKKRAVSTTILGASLLAAHFVQLGWAHEHSPVLLRALPSGLALGVVVARTATSLFDYVAANVRTQNMTAAATKPPLWRAHALTDTARPFSASYPCVCGRCVRPCASSESSAPSSAPSTRWRTRASALPLRKRLCSSSAPPRRRRHPVAPRTCRTRSAARSTRRRRRRTRRSSELSTRRARRRTRRGVRARRSSPYSSRALPLRWARPSAGCAARATGRTRLPAGSSATARRVPRRSAWRSTRRRWSAPLSFGMACASCAT